MTIGRVHTGSKRDYAHVCDVCGVTWLRSQLVRKANGTLVCPDDARGKVEADLDRANGRGLSATRAGQSGATR